ncbi:hypothetical protein V5G24_00115 [Xanthobacter sp. VTT E-85241]|uniref:hypothetical protein n=1 Tax=Roseixanthobacter finlandensis TaxID=3119922 RepID=UPI0037269DE4
MARARRSSTSLSAAPLLAWDAEHEVAALRERRAELLLRLARCRRWRSQRHQILATELADITARLIVAELAKERALRDRLLMRD